MAGSSTEVVWDIRDGTQPATIGRPLSLSTTVAFSPDGRLLAIGGYDDRVSLWDMTELDDLRAYAIPRACALAGRGLTPREWDHLVGLPYQRTC